MNDKPITAPGIVYPIDIIFSINLDKYLLLNLLRKININEIKTHMVAEIDERYIEFKVTKNKWFSSVNVLIALKIKYDTGKMNPKIIGIEIKRNGKNLLFNFLRLLCALFLLKK